MKRKTRSLVKKWSISNSRKFKEVVLSLYSIRTTPVIILIVTAATIILSTSEIITLNERCGFKFSVIFLERMGGLANLKKVNSFLLLLVVLSYWPKPSRYYCSYHWSHLREVIIKWNYWLNVVIKGNHKYF